MYGISEVARMLVQLILVVIAEVEISLGIVGYCSSVVYYVFEANES